MFLNYITFFATVLVALMVSCTQSKECYSCVGINCLRASKVNSKATCVDPVDNCVTVFDGFTIVARGCYSSMPEEHRIKCDGMSDSQCHKCYKSLCNNKGAISCLQCNSESNTDCYSGVSKIEPSRCPSSTSTVSYCFTRTSSNKIERGCLVDTSEQLKCLGESSCEMCIADNKDTCNRESAESLQSGSNTVKVNGVLLGVGVWSLLVLLQIY